LFDIDQVKPSQACGDGVARRPAGSDRALVLDEFVSMGFYASVGGLLIAGTLAFVVGTSAADPFTAVPNVWPFVSRSL
jgi:hypothetical protein